MRFMRVSVVIPAYNEEENIKRLLKDIFLIFKGNHRGEIIVVDDGGYIVQRITSEVMKQLLSIFLPVFNEEEILEKNVMKIYEFLTNFVDYFEIYIIDDGSTDLTPQIGKKLAQKSGVRYLRFERGPSRRENLAQAFKKASGDIIVYMDIDLSSDFRALPKLIDEIQNGMDIVIGSRYVKGAKTKRVFWRLIMSLAYNNFIRFFFNSKIKDHQCGFKVFKKSVLLGLVDETGYDRLFKRGWFWDAEILIRGQKKGYKISEVPITWEHRDKGSFNFRRELKIIPYILELKMKL